MPPRPTTLVLTCEHGGNTVPAALRSLFARHAAVLQTHRAYDRGALVLARLLARRAGATLFAATTTRLVVDLNRSLGHPKLFSELTRPLPQAARQRLLQRHYLPHRRRVETHMAALIRQGHRILHLGVHSFTPVLGREVRKADLALLYDPARRLERDRCRAWQRRLRQVTSLTVRLNYPYRGAADGFTTYLRRRFAASHYLGIELEVNQRHVEPPGQWRILQQHIAAALLDELS